MFSILNIAGLVPDTRPSKVPYIASLAEHNPMFISLTETWLYESHRDAEIEIPGYTLHPKNREGRTKKKGCRASGGVGLYLRDDLATSSDISFSFSNGETEAAVVTIPILNAIVIVVYRSPTNDTTKFSPLIRKLRSYLQGLPTPAPDILLMGDVNLPHADWESGESRPSANPAEKTMTQDLFGLANEFFLVQQLEGSTHRAGNLLDLLFTNNAQLINRYEITPCPRSDHHLIDVHVAYKSNVTAYTDNEPLPAPEGFWALNFLSEDVDWSSLSDALANHDWTAEFRHKTSDECLAQLVSVSQSYSTENVPPRTKPPTESKSKPQRCRRERRLLRRKRGRLKRQYHLATLSHTKAHYYRLLIANERKLHDLDVSDLHKRENDAISKIKTNPKYFFSYAKSLSKAKVGIGPLICNRTKTLVASPKLMSEILSSQYASAFSTPSSPPVSFPDDDATSTPHRIENVTFDESEIVAAINTLSATSAAGPDGFPAILLKRCSQALSNPLATILRKSIDEGSVPSMCKVANIIPVHKGKSKAAAKNYRPIALTSIISKIFEKVIRSHLVTYLAEFNLFNPSQHGFRANRSCLSQLLDHCDRIQHLLTEGKGVDVIYLDFAKAFDKVDHNITLAKLKSLGITGRLGRWLQSFLLGRQQTVIVEGRPSDPHPVLSGVPQGSVLGPLLFLILIGDIDQNIAESFLASFADDTRVGHEIREPADAVGLQSDLNSVFKWAESNNMEFNSDKFELIKYRPTAVSPFSTHYYANDNSEIAEKSSLRDLGVTLQNDCSYSEYIHSQCQSVRGTIGWVLRTFHTRQLTPMMTLWKQVIRFHLEYASQLWSPAKLGDIQSIEILQSSFLRHIPSVRHLNYWEQLKSLKLYSLQRRRERYTVIYVWRILEGHVPNLSSTPITTRPLRRHGRLCNVPLVPTSSSCKLRRIREA